MEHLRSYNEGLFNWRRKRGKKPLLREFNKDDLYSYSVSYKDKIGPKDLNDNNTFYAMRFPDMSLDMIKNHIVSDKDMRWLDKGVFGRFGGWSWEPDGFAKSSSVSSTKKWYDLGDSFVNLRKISRELGYDLNTTVHVKETQKDSKIVEIRNFAFWKMVESLDHYIKECITLLYKVEDDDNWYQIEQIEKVEISDADKNIVDEIIEENFLDLMDEGLISFVSDEFTVKGKKGFNCLVKVSKDINPEILFKISESLLVASRRLNDMGIYIDIKSMNHVEDRHTKSGTTDIKFTAIHQENPTQ